jgi:methyl-accepting chemotaxis protein
MNSPAPNQNNRNAGPGLRIRLWIACLTPSVLAAIALGILAYRGPVGPDAEFHWVWLPAALGGAIVLSIAFAIWLDRGIVRHLRGLERSMAEGEVTDLRGLPSSSGWGEISSLTIQTAALLARQRQAGRTAQELEQLSTRLLALRDGVEVWTRAQIWTPMVPEGGALGALVGLLNRELPRISEWLNGGRELTGALVNEIGAGMPEAREVAEQAERGFVEATALLTTVRELERLGSELDGMLALPARAANERSEAAELSLEQFRAAASDAIERLITASGESVAHLADGLAHVQEIGERTRLIANRTTLIALNALTANARPPGVTAETMHHELKALATDVREASDRVDALTAGIERQAAAARECMEQVRVSIAGALAAALPASEESAPEIMPDTTRLMERVREMIRDAAAKGERLSSAGERVSRAAARLQRRVESEATSVGQLAASLQLEGQPKRTGGKSGGSHLRVVEPGESAAADATDDDPAPTGDADPPAGAKPQAHEIHEAHEPHELPESPPAPRLRSREEGK